MKPLITSYKLSIKCGLLETGAKFLNNTVLNTENKEIL